MSVVDASFEHPLELEEHAAGPLAGGIANMGYQCGMLWGAALAAGAHSFRLYGPGSKAEAEAVIATQNLVETFRDRTKHLNCMDITEMNMQKGSGVLKFLLKGGPIVCFVHTAGYAPEVRNGIEAYFAEEQSEVPSPPVSCASVLAGLMGASDMHTVMAAGFAGGIGLSGEACGALGTAIWLTSMDQPVEMEGFSYAGTWVNDVVEKYLESSDYEFECSEVVGQKFESLEDHAAFIREGGCSHIIEALAAYEHAG